MPAQLLLVNPRRKRRAKRARARNPKRRRVTARRSTARRHKRRAVGYSVGSAPVRRRKLNPRRRKIHSKRRRHNPRLGSLFSVSGLMHQLVPAAIGGAGAVALDIGLSYLPASTPAFLTSGIGNKALKVGGAILLGVLAGKVLGREKGKAVAAGALTVVAYGIIRDTVKQVAPTLPGLSGTDGDYVYQPAPMLMGAYMDNGMSSFQQAQMGAYMTNDGM